MNRQAQGRMLTDRNGARRRLLVVKPPELHISRRRGAYYVTKFLVAEVDEELWDDRRPPCRIMR